MFRFLGRIAVQYRVPIILFWIALAITLPTVAPSLEDVGTSDQRDFLPGDAPFAQAERLYQDAFPENFSPSSGIVVVDSGAAAGIAEDTPAWQYLQALTAWLASEDAPDNILDVSSPTLDPAIAARLISEDGRHALVVFGLSTSDADKATIDTVGTIDDWIDDNPPPDGIAAYHTGQAKINVESDEVTLETLDQTLIITVALIIIFLLAIYRSPVSPLIPLFTVTMALLVTTGLLGLLGDAGVLTIISQMTVFLIVVMYGAGTDYCLFLISRFREEMADVHDVTAATQDTVYRVGETISSSAATIVVGFTAMAFSEMSVFAHTGPMLAVGVIVGLLAGLTLTPALLSLLGERAFWPNKAQHRAHGRWYDFTSRLVSSRPLLTILVIVVVMVPFGAYGLTRDVSYEFMADYPDTMESVEGYHLLEDYFGGGLLYPLTVVAADRSPEALAADQVSLSQDLAQIEGVDDVFSLNDPLGLHSEQYQNLLRVDTQLQLALGLVSQALQAGDPQPAQSAIAGAQAYLDRLAARFPEIADDPDLAQLQGILGGGAETVAASQEALSEAAASLGERLASLDNPTMLLSEGGPLFEQFGQIAAAYLSQDGRAFQMSVTIRDEPGTERSFETIDAIRAVLARYEDSGPAGVSGTAVVLADIRDTVQRDLLQAFGFVLFGIFVVLLVMLRSAIAPLYLICTVVLSYTFTLGVTNLVFDVFFDTPKLSFFVPFMMFVFLVALGIDYSIFLFGRIKEEVGNHGIHEGVHVAVATTGTIITSAGMILAGTFAGLMAGDIKFLAEVGFAVAFGVLIDTFVVRTVLDPALAALFGRWTWWPGGVPKAQPRASGAPAATASGELSK
ncbi:MMPL family transporter [Aggregatilinea lenta]|uniref:MMPL family transporter n=1 Tax=Aggregatilinea lenta TaxID=913108 RepID=UPI0013C31234|nr:MMPL family transporter [Aggregatilinea lenta]